MPEVEGRIAAIHTWESTGVRQVELCLADSEEAFDCDRAEVSVEDLVSLGVGPRVLVPGWANKRAIPKGIPDHKRFEYELTVVNQEPSTGAGLTAQAVTFDGRLPPGLVFRGIEARDPDDLPWGSCSRNRRRLSCDLETLEAGQEIRIMIAVQGPGDLVYDEVRELRGDVQTSSATLDESVEVYVSVNLLADPTDTDGDGITDVYEQAHGLRTNRADGDGDLDGDGLSNLDEFEAHTAADDADTDNDGLSDYKELRRRFTDPLDPDSDADGMSDGWEVRHRLDPNDPSDANGDIDQDGYTNRQEYESRTDARDASDNPGVSAAVELIMEIVLDDAPTDIGR